MPQVHNQRERKPVNFKPKEKAWSHQDEFTKGVGKGIVIHTTSEIIEGKIIAADQFSVKVDIKSASEKDPAEIVLFKSAIRYFEVRA